MSSKSPSYTPLEITDPNDESNAPLSSSPPPPSSSRIARFENGYDAFMRWSSDTWGPEVLALFASMGSSAAIGILGWIWSGKTLPQLRGGFTVNAILSILGTVSKSAMLFIVSSCIAQTKWIWAGQARSLLTMQSFDDASRGPLGALYLLADRKAWSVASLGAFVTLLALAFDPFVQQSLNIPILPFKTASLGSLVKRNLALPRILNDNGLSNFESMQILKDIDFNQIPICKADNCTWPSFDTVSMCQKCQSVEVEVIRPFSWVNELPRPTGSSLNTSDSDSSGVSIELEIRMADFNPFNLTVGTYFDEDIDANGTAEAYASSIVGLRVQATIVSFWEISSFNDFLILDGQTNALFPDLRAYDFWEKSRYRLASRNILGVTDPLKVYGYFIYEWLDYGPKIFNSTVCILDPCVQKYQVSVTQNVPSVQLLEETFGEKYLRDTAWTNHTNQTLCWKPHGYDTVKLDSEIGNTSFTSFYDPESLAFCDDDLLRDNQTDRYLGLPVNGAFGLGTHFGSHEASISVSGAILLDEMDKTLVYKTDETSIFGLWSYIDSMSHAPFHWDISNRTDSLADGLKEEKRASNTWPTEKFWQIFDLGIDRLMVNLAGVHTQRTLDQFGVSLPGHTVSMIPYVQVRWLWLILPWLLLVGTAVLLGLTIWSTRRVQVPLWKTSFTAALLPLLEKEDQTSARGEKVSQIDEVAEKVNVVLDDYNVNGRLRLRVVQ